MDHTELSPRKQLAYSTVRIEAKLPGGGSTFGTGFFVTLACRDQVKLDLLVTNRHVIDGAIGWSINMSSVINGKIESSPMFRCDFPDVSWWANHPNPSIDLCAAPILPAIQECGFNSGDVFYISIGADRIASIEDFQLAGAGEAVLMIGYPNGLWDEIHNFPLFRQGITSTDPEFDFCGKPEFMIDCACFPGSSGSPVFSYSETIYRDHVTGKIIDGYKSKLLGILYSGPTITSEGQIIRLTRPYEVARVESMLNLGYAIKATALSDFCSCIQS
jgi:hypothetical protein